MLHGILEDHFEKWYEIEVDRTDHLPPLNMFGELTVMLRYGMYIDFLNRRGLKISLNNSPDGYEFYIYYKGMRFFIDDVQSLGEMYIKSINKANTVYNEFYSK